MVPPPCLSFSAQHGGSFQDRRFPNGPGLAIMFGGVQHQGGLEQGLHDQARGGDPGRFHLYGGWLQVGTIYGRSLPGSPIIER